MDNLITITDNGSEWSPDKAFKKLHKILIDMLDEILPKLDSAKTGVQKMWIDNHVKNSAATKSSSGYGVYKTQIVLLYEKLTRLVLKFSEYYLVKNKDIFFIKCNRKRSSNWQKKIFQSPKSKKLGNI